MVIVGASLAGLHAAHTLRDEGFAGELTLIGDEPHLPYDRPPLSKGQLASDARDADVDLPVADDVDAAWLLGTAATGLDLAHRVVRLADDRLIPFDGLVMATGTSARTPAPAQRPPLTPVFTLRTRDDAARLRDELLPHRHAVVVGGGFLGSEVAASIRGHGLDVTLVTSASQPLARVVGAAAGSYAAALHREAGITVLTGQTATAEASAGRLAGGSLSNGSLPAADLVVLALGGTPNTGWLSGSGVAVDHGVICDPYLRVRHEDGSVLPGVVAAGDVVRLPHPLADGRLVALGHWSNAVDQAATAARNLLRSDDVHPFTSVPSFWSDLHGVTLRAVGLPSEADDHQVAEYDLPARKLQVTHHRDGRPVGALSVGRNGWLAARRRALTDSLTSL
ncbi:NAD(P)/FAD-dependent oxidoreductase [Streptomyces sp. VRA16 Mangrove soil]|nr:NAD(P)/FAD-dependent oxidoreductase [Streptomyces sp. VRA16 Mangrove soil]